MRTLNHLFKSFFLFLLVVLVITACSKTGPQGAPGPQGVAGPAGTVAKVIYSPWITPDGFGYSSDVGGPYFLYQKDDTAISQAILNNGAVLIYGKLNGYDG